MSKAFIQSPVEEVVEFFSRGPSREEVATFRLSDAARERLRELLASNSAGTLSDGESRELDQMVLLDDIVALIRIRARTTSLPDTKTNGSASA